VPEDFRVDRAQGREEAIALSSETAQGWLAMRDAANRLRPVILVQCLSRQHRGSVSEPSLFASVSNQARQWPGSSNVELPEMRQRQRDDATISF
jgi:hypothetical protein